MRSRKGLTTGKNTADFTAKFSAGPTSAQIGRILNFYVGTTRIDSWDNPLDRGECGLEPFLPGLDPAVGVGAW
jgi:hypothetical protein